MRAKLLIRVMWVLLCHSVALEAIAEVEADQIRVRLVGAVEVVVLGDAVRAAGLEVKRELGEVDDPRAAVVANAEGGAFAIGVGKERTDTLERLRVLVIQHAEAD